MSIAGLTLCAAAAGTRHVMLRTKARRFMVIPPDKRSTPRRAPRLTTDRLWLCRTHPPSLNSGSRGGAELFAGAVLRESEPRADKYGAEGEERHAQVRAELQ